MKIKKLSIFLLVILLPNLSFSWGPKDIPPHKNGIVMKENKIPGTDACELTDIKRGICNCGSGLKFPSFNNYINNNNVFKDERRFLKATEHGTESFLNTIEVEPGDTIFFVTLVHNNAVDLLYPAKNVSTYIKQNTFRIEGDYIVTNWSNGKPIIITQYISSSNSTPRTIWDSVKIKSKRNIRLKYVTGQLVAKEPGKKVLGFFNNEVGFFVKGGMKLGDKFDPVSGIFRGGALYIKFMTIIEEKNEAINNPKDVSGERIALIIGNSNYKYGKNLKNPLSDAKAMEKVLQKVGFKVLKYENCNQKIMKKSIDKFGTKIKKYKVALFYFAGHGIQVDGKNYLIPVDAKLEYKNDTEYECVRADRVLAKMKGAGSKTNIVILDACRNNPFTRSWDRGGARSKGLAFMNAPSGSIIAYSTSPGNTASDGVKEHSFYTSALLKYIDYTNITIEEMFKKVRSHVIKQTNKKQIPWESTSLTGNFYFNRK